MKQAMSFVLSMLLVCAGPVQTADEFVNKSYLDLLELDVMRKFPAGEIESAEKRLKAEEKTEQGRLKKDQKRIEDELRGTRDRLADWESSNALVTRLHQSE